MIIVRLCCLLSLFFCMPINATILLHGDEKSPTTQTFSFQVQQYAVSTSAELAGANLYVGAHPSDGGAGQVNEFAVSYVNRSVLQFIGLTPKTVKLNFSKDNVANPLYDQGIAFMSLFDGEGAALAGALERPVVVTNSDRKTIYLINNFNSDGTGVVLLSANASMQNIPDANGAVTGGIVKIEAVRPYVFAAVGPATGSFGALGSGIALIGVISFDNKKFTFTGPLIFDAPTGAIGRVGGDRAVPLDVSSTVLKISSDLASIGSVVDMCWHGAVGRLYVALQVQGSGAVSDGARALAVGRISQVGKLELNPIAPVGVFDDPSNEIIGALGSNVAVSIHRIRPMLSTTALPYLIMVGDVGSVSATRRTVYALPLVRDVNDQALVGTIAAKDAEPTDIFTPTTIPLFVHRSIKNAATAPAQMPRSTDMATKVGGGAIVNGDITDMFVQGDTVFVSVQTPAAGQVSGLFYSQALFDEKGKIKGWTTWRRAAGTRDHVQSAVLDPVEANLSLLVENAVGNVTAIKRTTWNSGDVAGISPLTVSVERFFARAEAGVQGIQDFVITSGALGTQTPGLLDISLLIATGNKKVLCAQTSSTVSGAIVPYGGADFGELVSFIQGEITQTFPVGASRMLLIEGGVLSTLGAISSAEIAVDGLGNGWLFVGGVGGVAVLSKSDGSGWNVATGLSDYFTGLTAGMTFKLVGLYEHVRKLMHDDRYLYVLTNTKLDRIDLAQGNVGLGTTSVHTIATVDSIPGIGQRGTLLDMIVSEKLLILATSGGLFRLANGLDGRAVDTSSALWTPIGMNEGTGTVQQVYAVTVTGRQQDIARVSGGGNLYVLSAYRGKNRANLFRFAVKQVVGTAISDTTIQRIPDLFVKDIDSYFANFGLFKHGFSTDGSLFCAIHNKRADGPAEASTLFSKGGIFSGSGFLTNKRIPINFDDGSLITSMLQSSASGSWLVAGDYGIRVRE